MRTRTRRRSHERGPTMSAEEARVFTAGERANSIARFEAMRSARVAAGAHPAGCTCTPYHSVFTFSRWDAQGRRPIKGTRSFQMPIWRELKSGDDQNGDDPQCRTRLVRSRAVLFCKCQTTEAHTSDAAPFAYDVPQELLTAERAEFNRPDGGDPAPKPERPRQPQEPDRRRLVTLPAELAAQLIDAAEVHGQAVRLYVDSCRWEQREELRAAIEAAGGDAPDYESGRVSVDPARWLVIALCPDIPRDHRRNLCIGTANVMAAFRPACGVFIYPSADGIGAELAAAAAASGLNIQAVDIGPVDLRPDYRIACEVARVWLAENAAAETAAA